MSNVSRKAREAGTGRLLVASLHQAIADVIPSRLEFYEHWLRSQVLRDGGLGRAPLSAVLGFLRTEEAYGDVVGRAGALAADWATVGRRTLGVCVSPWLPLGWATRLGLGVGRRLLRDTSRSRRPRVLVVRGTATIVFDGSVFCDVRERAPHALCGYYASMVARALRRCGLEADVHPTECRATGGSACVLEVEVRGRRGGDSDQVG